VLPPIAGRHSCAHLAGLIGDGSKGLRDWTGQVSPCPRCSILTRVGLFSRSCHWCSSFDSYGLRVAVDPLRTWSKPHDSLQEKAKNHRIGRCVVDDACLHFPPSSCSMNSALLIWFCSSSLFPAPLLLQKQHLLLHDGVVLEHRKWA